jgi:tetratricopeptide (TPR) repeat protein
VAISTESLLMEGARRIDEWSRIADQVPHLGVVPVLVAPDDGQGGLLDLLPGEWEVLGLIDGETDLRGIALALGRGEFEIAKIAYGLVTTGVIALEQPYRVSASALRPVGDAGPHVQAAQAALKDGDAPRALAAARSAQAVDPSNVEARLAAARALRRLGRVADAYDELRRAAMHDPDHAVVSYELAWTAAQRGAFDEAVERWEAWLSAQPSGIVADRVRMALDTTRRLRALVEAHVHG